MSIAGDVINLHFLARDLTRATERTIAEMCAGCQHAPCSPDDGRDNGFCDIRAQRLGLLALLERAHALGIERGTHDRGAD